MTASEGADDIQSYARLAGVLGVLTLVAGGFGEAYVPSAILVSGDPAATVRNVLALESLFRWGFAGYLVEALCDAGLTIAFWVLVRPVHRNLAMGMVVFRIISTCGFAAAMMLWFGALPTLKAAPQMATLPADHLAALAYTLLRVSGFGQALFSMFYGVANVIFGALIYRSGYLPRVFGVGFVIMGIAFTLRTFLLVLAPEYASPLLLVTAGIVFPPFIVWLLVKGVNVEKFHGRAWQRATT
jgi:hypothetical protein